MNVGPLLTILAVVCTAFFSFSQGRQTTRPQRTAPAGRPAFMQKIKFFEENANGAKAVLNNGLTVVVNEFPSFPLVEILTYVRTGLRDEPADAPGVASLLKRMICREATALGKEIPALSGVLKGYAGYEHSYYESLVPSEQWKRTLELQSEAMRSLSFNEEELRFEIDRMIREARRELDDPDAFAFEKLLELGFPNRRVRRHGSDAELRNLTRDKVLDFYKSKYGASRIILIVSGDVVSAEVFNEAVRLYEKLPAADAAKADAPVEASQGEFRYAQFRGNIKVPRVLFGFHTASADSVEFPAQEMLRTILGTGESSILARSLRDKSRAIVNHAVDITPYPGFLAVSMEARADALDRCEIDTLAELEILKRRQPDAGEMERAAAQLEREFWTRMQTLSGRAHALARFESMGDWKRAEGYVARIRQVKAAEISRVASRYLNLENCSLIEYLPLEAEPRNLTSAAMREMFQKLLESLTDREIAEREKATVPAFDIPKPPSAFRASEIRYPPRTASILRGPQMYVLEDHISPLIQMGFFFPGGKLFESDGNSGITALMLRSMLRGAPGRSPEQFFRQMEIYGAQVLPVVEDDYFGFFFTILSRNVEKGLALLGDTVRSPKFAEDEVAWQRELQISEIVSLDEHPASCAGLLLNRLLFRGHPYALNARGTEDAVRNLRAPDLEKWYMDRVKNRNPMIVVAGDTKGSQLAAYFVQHFSGSRFEDIKLPDVSPEPIERKELLQADWGRRESLILTGFSAPAEGDEDSYSLVVLQNHIRRKIGSFFSELRELQGLVYDVRVQYVRGVLGGGLVVSIATSPENEEKVLKAFEGEMLRLSDTPPLQRDHRRAVNTSVEQYWIDRQSRAWHISAIVKNALAGKEVEEFQNYPTFLEEVGEQELQDIARIFLDMDKSFTLLLRGNRSFD